MHELIDPTSLRVVAMTHAVTLLRDVTDGSDEQLLETATAIYRWLTQPIPDPAMVEMAARITALEERMSLSETALADLDAATNEVATELDELRGQIAATDSALADRIGAAANRLRSLAADPEQPVPPVEPAATGDEGFSPTEDGAFR